MGLLDFLKTPRAAGPVMTEELWFATVTPVARKSYADLVAAVGRKPDAEGISQMGALSHDGSTEYVWNFGAACGTASVDKTGKVTSIGFFPDGYATLPKGTDLSHLIPLFNKAVAEGRDLKSIAEFKPLINDRPGKIVQIM